MAVRLPRRRAWVVASGLLLVAVVAYATGLVLHRLDIRDRPRQARRLAASLGIGPGSTVAEVGAGDGSMAIEMARIVGPAGAVIVTEVSEGQLDVIRRAAREAGVSNLSCRLAGTHDSNLPPDCCQAVYLQRVYHHLTDPSSVMASVSRALKPHGRLGVLEFEPGWIANWSTPAGVPDRGGHGVPKPILVSEMRGHGFEAVGPPEDFGLELYIGIFARPTSANGTAGATRE